MADVRVVTVRQYTEFAKCQRPPWKTRAYPSVNKLSSEFPADSLKRDIQIDGSYVPSKLTPVAGSFFRPLSQTHISKRVWDFKFCFTWYPSDIILCLWSGFISPRIRTFVEKRFHGLCSKRMIRNLGVFLRFWVEAEVNFFGREKLSRRHYLDYLKKKIWRYGRSWTHF